MADKIQFKKTELNKKFQINVEKDKTIRLPGGREINLSDIEDEQVLQGLIERKSNLVSLKSTEEPKKSTDTGNPKP